ncbi:MAG: FtsX-like permease family protein, partial [Longimicrobiales bacterium]
VQQRIMERIAAIPGVASVGMSSSITMDGNDSNDAVYVEDFPTPEGQLPPLRRFKFIGPTYFETLGNRLIAGRPIAWSDIHSRLPVVVVTENFAREYWKEPAAALGERVRTHGTSPWREIIGVVADARDDGVSEPAPAIMYWPLLMNNFWGADVFAARSMSYAIRSDRVGSPNLLDEVRQAVWSENTSLPLANVRTLRDFLDRSMARTSFTLIMLGIAAGVALLLGTVGIYGVISYVVAQRTREIGVRVALGARRADIRGLVLRYGLALAAAGVALGAIAAVALTRLMTALLFGVQPFDPTTFAAVALLLAGVALLSSWLPARRAMRIDPIEALRTE